jgi:hypothetical protein
VSERKYLFSNLKITKVYKFGSLPKDTAEIETGMAEKSSPGTRQINGKNLVWFGEIERKLARLSGANSTRDTEGRKSERE